MDARFSSIVGRSIDLSSPLPVFYRMCHRDSSGAHQVISQVVWCCDGFLFSMQRFVGEAMMGMKI